MANSMRPWRKFHSALIDSERASRLSDSALALFTLLVLAQDDEGYFPWSAQIIRRVTISRTWTIRETTVLAEELVSVGMAFWDEDRRGIILDKGEELNGRPRKYREPFTYRSLPSVSTDALESSDSQQEDRQLPVGDHWSATGRARPDIDGDTDIDKEEESDVEAESGVGQADLPAQPRLDILGQFSLQELDNLRNSFPLLDLETEASKCIRWYQDRGQDIRNGLAVFRKWLERARPSSGAIPPARTPDSVSNEYGPVREKPPLPPSQEAAALWEKCKELLRGKVQRTNYSTWLAGTEGYAWEGDRFWVQTETPYAAEQLYRRAALDCEDALREIGNVDAELCLFVEPTSGAMPSEIPVVDIRADGLTSGELRS